MTYEDALNLVQFAVLSALEKSGELPTAENATLIGTVMVAMGEGMLETVREG